MPHSPTARPAPTVPVSRAGDAAPSPHAGDDATIVAALRRGDRAATEAFVREVYPRMLAAALHLLGNEHDAQDVVQEAVMGALAHLDQFRGEARLSTWAIRILVNTALMRRRRDRRDRTVRMTDLLPRFSEDGHRLEPARRGADGDECAAHAAAPDRADLLAAVRRRIDRLPDAYRTVLILRDMQGLSTDETAAVLAIRPGAVKVRLHRARMALRQMLEDEEWAGALAARSRRPGRVRDRLRVRAATA